MQEKLPIGYRDFRLVTLYKFILGFCNILQKVLLHYQYRIDDGDAI